MLALLAQLVAPPLQPGPVRLPESAPLEQRSPVLPAPSSIQQREPQPNSPAEPAPESEFGRSDAPDGPVQQQMPRLEGITPYSEVVLQRIFGTCLQSGGTPLESLNRCAAALTTRLVLDGYVNSRVYIRQTPEPGSLEVVAGRLAEIRIQSKNQALERRIRDRLRPLQGEILNMARLEEALLDLRRLPGVRQIKGDMGRVGTDVSQARLSLTVEEGSAPWQGDISLRNDGNAGSGEWRALGVALKPDLLTLGDNLLLVAELNADQQAELGATITSLSYTAPLSNRLKLTSSFGYSRRNLVEAPGALRYLTTRQFQGYGQLEWILNDHTRRYWSLFAGISGNRNDSFLRGQHFSSTGPGGWNQTGYARFGTNYARNQDRLGFNVSVYGLQGMPSFSTKEQLEQLRLVDVSPGKARALGGSLNLDWSLHPRVLLSLRGAGQYAFSELTSDMGFNLGSDTGLKGLPGSYISGDSGYLWTTELNWTFWTNRRMALQLVPFIGSGGVSSNRSFGDFSDTVGSAGVLVRWLASRQFNLELGWILPFEVEERLYWDEWLLGSGVYTKLQYRF